MVKSGFLKQLPKEFEEPSDGELGYFEQFKGLSFLQFNEKIGLPEKHGKPLPIFDYEDGQYQLNGKSYDGIFQLLQKHRHVWVKKATGLGVTELMLRYIAWACLVDDRHQGSQVCIVTGPRIELAIALINRLKRLFQGHAFKSKETVCELNGCRVEAFPSHHLDTMRGLPDVKLILLDEGDFFPPGQQQDARDVSERYIAKSNPHIVMVSTPNLPGGLFENIEKEKESECLYHRVFLPYDVGLNKIYTEQDIEQAKRSPSFEREYNLKYGYGIGNIFPYQLVDACVKEYPLEIKGSYSALAVDPAYGSSNFGLVGIEVVDGIMQVKDARQYERPSPSAMLEIVSQLAKSYTSVLVDSAHPGLITDLQGRGISARDVQFNKSLSEMTVTAAQAVKEQKVAIHPAFSELAYQLRAVTYNEKGRPDKKKLSFDLGDAFMMAVSELNFSGVGWADLGRD